SLLPAIPVGCDLPRERRQLGVIRRRRTQSRRRGVKYLRAAEALDGGKVEEIQACESLRVNSRVGVRNASVEPRVSNLHRGRQNGDIIKPCRSQRIQSTGLLRRDREKLSCRRRQGGVYIRRPASPVEAPHEAQ